jgi:hypothetical protein
MRIGGIAAAILTATACTASSAPDPWRLWTIDTLEARGDPAIVEPGASLRLLSAPYPLVGATKSGLQDTAHRGLTIFPAFSEGKTAAYMTTEIWQNFDEVWVQPLYVEPIKNGNAPIFGVDSTTRFYSPYWQVFTYSHPAGAPEFKSAKDVLDSHVPLAPNSGKFCAITRDQSLLAAIQQGDTKPLRPLTGDPVTVPINGAGYAEGNAVNFIDLGNQQRFTFDPQTLIVDETPLYAFALPDTDGFPVEVDLPRVGGTGPPHHPRCDGHANCTGVIGGDANTSGIPEFGALWRVYDVLLPATADVYVPDTEPALQNRVRALGFAATIPKSKLADEFILRVAIDGKSCLAIDPSTCTWLDSQNQIEAQVVEWRVTKTGTLVTCPLVEFNGKPVLFK